MTCDLSHSRLNMHDSTRLPTTACPYSSATPVFLDKWSVSTYSSPVTGAFAALAEACVVRLKSQEACYAWITSSFFPFHFPCSFFLISPPFFSFFVFRFSFFGFRFSVFVFRFSVFGFRFSLSVFSFCVCFHVSCFIFSIIITISLSYFRIITTPFYRRLMMRRALMLNRRWDGVIACDEIDIFHNNNN